MQMYLCSLFHLPAGLGAELSELPLCLLSLQLGLAELVLQIHTHLETTRTWIKNSASEQQKQSTFDFVL